MKKTLVLLLSLAFVGVVSAADPSTSGTITLKGSLTSAIFGVKFSAIACDAGNTEAECLTDMNAATFDAASFSENFVLENVIIPSEDDDAALSRVRYVMFEMRAPFKSFAGDYIELQAQNTSTDNDVVTTLSELVFKSVGGVFGQSTLGDSTNFLAPGESVLSGDVVIPAGSLQTVFNQSTELAANAQVVWAVGANPLVMRGLLKVEYGVDAAQGDLSSQVTFTVTIRK